MLLKELFDKEFLYESSKNENKLVKIFYKFDINIVKKNEEEVNQPQQEVPQNQGQDQNQLQQNTGTVDLSAPENTMPIDQQQPMPAEPTPEVTQPMPEMPIASVVTEDDDSVEINDDNNIVRRMEGEVVLQKEDVDNIQTVEDIVTRLTEEKVDGVTVLDEFTADVIQVLANTATQNQISTMIDKKSKIFVELIYGKKKEDGVGLRIIKRKNSDMVTTTMLVDNKIINAPYKKETIDSRIVDIRNGEYDEA